MRIVADTSSVDDQLLRDLTRIIDEIQRTLPEVDIDVDIDTTGLTRLRDEADDTDSSLGRLVLATGRTILTLVRMTAVASVSATAIVGLSGAIAGLIAGLGGLEGIANQAAGGLAVLLAARGVLQVALTGISEAFDALGEDTETFNAAIEDLAPSAQNVAREFRSAVPAFTAFRNGLQEALFSEIEGEESARRLAATLKTLRPAAQDVSTQFGNLADGLIDLITAPRIVADLNQILQTTADLLDRAVPKLIDFADRGITRAADGTEMFGETFDFLRSIVDAVTPVLQDLGRIFDAIGQAAQGTGAEIGGPLALALDLIADVLNSAPGQEFLRTLFELGQTITNALLPAVGTLLGALAEGLAPVIEAIAPIAAELATILADYVVQISPLLPLIGELAAAFLGALSPALDIISALLLSLTPVFVQFAQAILPALIPLVDALVVALDELAQPLADIAIQLGPPLAELFAALAPHVILLVESMIPLIPLFTEFALSVTDLATDLTELLVPAIEFVAALLEGDFSEAADAAERFMRESLDLIVGYFTDLPNRIVDGLNRFGQTILSETQSAGNDMVRELRRKIGDAIDELNRLPLRAAAALGNLGSTLYNSGRALIGGFIDGMLSRLGDVKNAAGNLLSSARDLFPFSPAKEGPFSGQGYTTYSGQALMDDFIAGLTSRSAALRQSLNDTLSGGADVLSPRRAFGAPAATLGRQFAMAGTSGAAPSVSVYLGNELLDRYVNRIVVANDQDNRRRAAQGVRR